ncbi:MAG: hypothetical protein ACI9B7_000062 [Oleispira sp.]|jgi:hypothetical protein
MPKNSKLLLLCLFSTGLLMGCSSSSTGTDTDTGKVMGTSGEELVLPSQLEVITRGD